MPETPLPNDSQAMAVQLVGPGRDVLEIGCGAGHVTERLVANGCTVTGVEIDPDAAESARAHAAEVHVADLDLVDLSDVLGDRRFDAIVVGDVFEHLKDPVRVLRSVPAHLTDDGVLVSSIPHVAHADVRLMLLGGRWQMTDAGLLDRTHLRFFDLPGVLGLFADGGFRIERLERTHKDPLTSELAPFVDPALADAALGLVEADPESATYQFVVVARPGARVEDAAARFAHPTADGPRAPSTGAARDRLLAENEQLRVKVRSLEERLEDALWVRAEWRDRWQRAAGLPRRGAAAARRRLRSGHR